MTMTAIILCVLALYLAQLFLQETSRLGFDVEGLVGNRDKLPEMSIIAARLDRAKNNMLEALPFFIALSLLSIVKFGDKGGAETGALIFLVARVLYIPAYASGLPWLRSIFWLAGLGGLFMMALRLV